MCTILSAQSMGQRPCTGIIQRLMLHRAISPLALVASCRTCVSLTYVQHLTPIWASPSLPSTLVSRVLKPTLGQAWSHPCERWKLACVARYATLRLPRAQPPELAMTSPSVPARLCHDRLEQPHPALRSRVHHAGMVETSNTGDGENLFGICCLGYFNVSLCCFLLVQRGG